MLKGKEVEKMRERDNTLLASRTCARCVDDPEVAASKLDPRLARISRRASWSASARR